MNKHKKTASCKTCGTTFSYTSIQEPTCCSKECRVEYVNKYHRERRKTMNGALRSIVAGCRNRAKRRGLDCDIDSEYIINLYNEQDGECAITGVRLETSNASGKTRWNPNTVTLDRIDSNKGYTKDNVQLVTIMYNNCKSNFTHEDVVKFCKEVLWQNQE